MDFKKIGKRLLYPPIWTICIMTALSAALLLLVFLRLDTEHPISYVCYVFSAYTLTVICFRIPDMIKCAKSFRDRNKFFSRYTSDPQFRLKLTLYGAVIYNFAYAVFQLGLGITHGSAWFYSLAVYYLLLVIIKFFLLRDVRADKIGKDMKVEYLRYRFCGIILVLMNVALFGIVLYITRYNYGFRHHYITTIALAAYTFTSMTFAIIDVIRYRKLNSPIFSASKVIGLASASVSMLTLETAMLSAFGNEGEEDFRTVMTALTGAAVLIFVLALAVLMIIRSTVELKKIRSDEENE